MRCRVKVATQLGNLNVGIDINDVLMNKSKKDILYCDVKNKGYCETYCHHNKKSPWSSYSFSGLVVPKKATWEKLGYAPDGIHNNQCLIDANGEANAKPGVDDIKWSFCANKLHGEGACQKADTCARGKRIEFNNMQPYRRSHEETRED